MADDFDWKKRAIEAAIGLSRPFLNPPKARDIPEGIRQSGILAAQMVTQNPLAQVMLDPGEANKGENEILRQIRHGEFRPKEPEPERYIRPAEVTLFDKPVERAEGGPVEYTLDERTIPIEELEKRRASQVMSYAPREASAADADASRAISRAAPERGERLQEGTVFPHEPSKVAGADDVWNRMITMESGGRQFDRFGRPLRSSAGAIGIAQVMPGTGPIAASYANLPWDPERYYNDKNYNLALGRAYYERQLAKYGDPILAAAAYNTGPGNLDRALRRAQETGRDWRTLVHPETQKYVRFVAQVPQQTIQRPVQVAQATQNDATPMRSGVFAFGTNDPDPDVTLKSAQRIWEQSQRVGIQPVFVLPNPNDQRFAPMARALKDFADKNGIKYEIPTYEARDPLHMTPKSAQDIAARYPNAVVAGDSNSWRIQKFGYNRPVTGPNTFVDPDSNILLGRVGAGSPDIASWFTNYADYLQRQTKKDGGRTGYQTRGRVISKLFDDIFQTRGAENARRVERAADEIPNLEKLYTPEALASAFRRNDQLLMTMKPEDFLKFAAPFEGKPTPKYIQELSQLPGKGGFEDVPFLQFNRITNVPVISGHEGRHRSLALQKIEQPTSLVQLEPSPTLREAIKDQIREKRPYANPYEGDRFMMGIRRELPEDLRVVPQNRSLDEWQKLELPEPYKKGGSVVDQALVVVSTKANRRRGRPE